LRIPIKEVNMTGYSNYDIFMNYCENYMDAYNDYDNFDEYDYDDLEDFGSGGYKHLGKRHDALVKKGKDFYPQARVMGARLATTNIKNPNDRERAMGLLNIDKNKDDKKFDYAYDGIMAARRKGRAAKKPFVGRPDKLDWDLDAAREYESKFKRNSYYPKAPIDWARPGDGIDRRNPFNPKKDD